MTTVTKVLIGVGGLIVIVGGILLYRNYQNKETTTTPILTGVLKLLKDNFNFILF